jgi:myo-inositol-1(or 4)-monophosphatase
MIKSELKKHFSGHNFLCEESGSELSTSEYTWIIDPLDGTVNFAKKVPFFAVNIALKKNTDIVFAATYSPMTSELFYALKSQGAYLNEKQIFVSNTDEITKAFSATGFPYRVQDNVSLSLKPIENILKMGAPLRRLGSAALDLAYIAAGRFDVFFESYLEPWDYASGMLLVHEAGGKITDFQNNLLPATKGSSVLATNSCLHQAMLNEVIH